MKYVYLVAAGALAAPMALAQSTDGRGWYGGVGYEYLVVDNDAINDRELDTLSITGGMNLNKSFGAEVTAATGIGDDSVNYGNCLDCEEYMDEINQPVFSGMSQKSLRICTKCYGDKYF